MTTRLRILFIVTDIAFIVYWTITALHLIPAAYGYNDYTNPILVAWNWSFLPLDLLVSATGLTSVYLHQRGAFVWRQFALISLILTFCSGLQAIVFWTIRQDFDLAWWAVNLYLLVYPLICIPGLLDLQQSRVQAVISHNM